MLSNFIKDNEIDIGKVIIKGYITGTQVIDNIDYNVLEIYYISTRKKKFLQKMLKICYKDGIESKYYIFDKFFIDKFIKIDKCFKPLGFLQTEFSLNMETIFSDFIYIEELENFKYDILDEGRYFEVSKNKFLININKPCFVPDEMIVHNGKMHADDILAAALVKYVNPNTKIIRTRNIPEDFKGLVADVGGGRYDHHDMDKPRIDKETGEQLINKAGALEYYAAFGLLAKDILPGYLGEKGYEIVDDQYIRNLDDADNNGTFDSFARMLEYFNPAWNSNEKEDDTFNKAVDIAIQFIERIIEREKAKQDAIPYVLSKVREMKDNILVLDKRAPWQGIARKSDAILCIYPVDEGWAIQCVQSNNVDVKENKTKMLLPASWLERNDIVFCHSALHFAIFDTKENAIKNAKEIIN